MGEAAWRQRETLGGCGSGSVRAALRCVKLIDCGDVGRPGYMREQEPAWAIGGCCAQAPCRASGAGFAWLVPLSLEFRGGLSRFQRAICGSLKWRPSLSRGMSVVMLASAGVIAGCARSVQTDNSKQSRARGREGSSRLARGEDRAVAV